MKLTKSMLAAGIITTVAAGSLVGTSLVSAQSDSTKSSIVDKIAEKFSLNSEDVQAVFDEVHQERHQEMEAKQAERIASLVEEGSLTQEQADALQAKHDEMEATRESLRDQNLSREEMHNQMDSLRDEFETWAEEQGINLDTIRPEGDKGFVEKDHRDMHNHMEGAETE